MALLHRFKTNKIKAKRMNEYLNGTGDVFMHSIEVFLLGDGGLMRLKLDLVLCEHFESDSGDGDFGTGSAEERKDVGSFCRWRFLGVRWDLSSTQEAGVLERYVLARCDGVLLRWGKTKRCCTGEERLRRITALDVCVCV
eukprot:TRINITY_DN5617_c0_g1_i3.p1 TRINITY_DN5617_c0_g1~~TRINITY_DN5617_c0_g1_i3.p1  ORF type:complete len:140 (+),score=25.25 TRINITY_DN5617_c0_g1_i3:190-609(+)